MRAIQAAPPASLGAGSVAAQAIVETSSIATRGAMDSPGELPRRQSCHALTNEPGRPPGRDRERVVAESELPPARSVDEEPVELTET